MLHEHLFEVDFCARVYICSDHHVRSGHEHQIYLFAEVMKIEKYCVFEGGLRKGSKSGK